MRFFASKVYTGKMTTAVREKFGQSTKRAMRQFVTDQLNERLKAALGGGSPSVADSPAPTPASEPAPAEPEPEGKPAVVTTDAEREAYFIVRAILRETVDVRRVALRDQQSYCSILLDDNNRKPLARLYFNGSKKYIGIFDGAERKEEKVPVQDLDDLFMLAPRLKATVEIYQPTDTE